MTVIVLLDHNWAFGGESYKIIRNSFGNFLLHIGVVHTAVVSFLNMRVLKELHVLMLIGIW